MGTEKNRKKKLVIIGADGHGKVIADIAVQNGYREIAFLDDGGGRKECAGYPVLGKSGDAGKFAADVVVGIGDANVRKRIQDALKDENVVTLVHPDAVVARDVVLGAGCVVMAGAVVVKNIKEKGMYIGMLARKKGIIHKNIREGEPKHLKKKLFLPVLA